MNNLILAIIGINTNYEGYAKYLIYFSTLLFFVSNIGLYYGIYNIFVFKTNKQIIQCLMHSNDIIIYLHLLSTNMISFINKFYNEEINPNIKNKIINPLFVLILVLSIIVSIIYCILSSFNVNFILINELTDNIYLKIPIIFLYSFYSSVIRLYSCLIFYSIFFTILRYIKDFKATILEENYNIPTICQYYLEIKHKYASAVGNLNVILSTNILCNYISVYLFINNIFESNFIDLLTVRSVIYFFICIIPFHYIITSISDYRDKINFIINNNRYIRMFLERKKDNYGMNIELSTLGDYNNNELTFKNYLLEIENGDSIDWMILNNVIVHQWKPFEIFGFEFGNNEIILKLLSLFIFLWIGKSIL